MVTRETADDLDLIAQHPLLLCLLPPTIGDEPRLPPPPASLPATPSPSGSEAAVRESLRLRARWVQELTARAALALGGVLVDRGVLDRATAVVDLRLDELASLVESGGSLAVDLRRAAEPGPPLPASFRLTVDGTVVPVDTVRGDGGRGAGGGRGTGPVHVGTDEPPSPGDVLVVRTLDPALASLLPGLGGLVAETGQRAVAPRDPRPGVRRPDRRRAPGRGRPARPRLLGRRRRHDGRGLAARSRRVGCGVTARRIGLAALLAVMAAAGWYVFVYLYRWEWNRALVSGIIFLAAEIGLLATLVLERLNKLGRRVDNIDRARADERALRRLREHAPEPARPFAWLDRSQTNVFVPVLLGAGVVLSALAWVVDRVARLTAVPSMERGLVQKLAALQPHPDGMLGEDRPDPFVPR